ncbi:MAG: hypothetical protein ACFB9N_09225 [Geitlerinemataceae cyanobacterium]
MLEDFDWRLDPAQLSPEMLRGETSFEIVEAQEARCSLESQVMRFHSWSWFKAEFQPGDRLYEYSSVVCDGTFCSGTEGLAIVREGQIVSAFVRSIWD